MRALAVDIGGSSVKSAIVEGDRSHWEIITRYAPHRVGGDTIDELRSTVLDVVSVALREIRERPAILGISTTGSVGVGGAVVGSGLFHGLPEHLLVERVGG
jgi:predicted NBD/HSP70 family sugar kinase